MAQVQKSELQNKQHVTKWGHRNNREEETAEDDYYITSVNRIIINLLHISVCCINNHTNDLLNKYTHHCTRACTLLDVVPQSPTKLSGIHTSIFQKPV